LTAIVVAASVCIAGAAQDKDLAPIYCPAKAQSKTPRLDGSKLTGDDLPTGFGKTRLRIAERYLARRDENLAAAAGIIAELEEIMAEVETTEEPEAVKKKLEVLATTSLPQAETDLLEAIDLEQKRLLLMTKALEAAFKDRRKLDGVDSALVEKLLARHESGDVEKAAKQYIAGLRLVARGLIDYIDKDMVAAIAKMENATKECPDRAVAFLYLGSFSYIVDQLDTAVTAWRRVLELEPDNKDVRAALKALGVSTVAPKKKQQRTDRHKKKNRWLPK